MVGPFSCSQGFSLYDEGTLVTPRLVSYHAAKAFGSLALKKKPPKPLTFSTAFLVPAPAPSAESMAVNPPARSTIEKNLVAFESFISIPQKNEIEHTCPSVVKTHSK